jgi:dihydrofolate reductase/thymidylate synthase
MSNLLTSIIVAVDSKGGIAKNTHHTNKISGIPWHIPNDLKYFKDITTKTHTNDSANTMNVLIMGRNTWHGLPSKFRPLKDRITIVISKTMTQYHLDNDNATGSPAYLARSFDNALEICKDLGDKKERIFICGGYSIYKEALERNIVDTVYLTKVKCDYGCDVFFPIDTLKRMEKSKYYKVITMSKWNEYQDLVGKEKEYFDKENKYPSINLKITYHFYKLQYENDGEKQYLDLLRNIIWSDTVGRKSRNAPTYSIFGPQIEFDLRYGFPLLTTKRMFWKGIVEELLFFIRGDTNNNHLVDKGVHIWDANTSREFLDGRGLEHYEVGDMGSMYGYNWRHFGNQYQGMDEDYTGKGYDQLRDVINLLKTDSNSRRIMMTTYDPSTVSQCVLAPCHGLIIQFYIDNEYMDCKMYQRSCDTFLGCPFNIASYALLMHMLAHVTGYKPRKLIMTFGDAHVYKDHLEQVKEQINRSPMQFPSLEIGKGFDTKSSVEGTLQFLEGLCLDDFVLRDYKSYPGIKASMFV